MFVSKRLRGALLDFAALLRDTRPRLIGAISCRSFTLLTDAFYDPGESPAAGLGGTILTGHGTALIYFSVKVTEQDCAKLALNDEATVIYELELLAVLVLPLVDELERELGLALNLCVLPEGTIQRGVRNGTYPSVFHG